MQFDTRKVSFFMLLIALVLLCMPIEKADASDCQVWSGVWLTNHGEMKLKQDGENVSGDHYVDNEVHGRFEGVIVDEGGFILRGNYYQGTYARMFEFRIVDNKRFQGWLNSPDDIWTGKLMYGEVKQQEMTILNNSPYHITALFVCPADSEEWQEVLGGTELPCGKQRNVIFNLDNSVCKWDIKVVDSSGSFTVFQALRIKQDFTSVDYYYKNGSGWISFAVG